MLECSRPGRASTTVHMHERTRTELPYDNSRHTLNFEIRFEFKHKLNFSLVYYDILYLHARVSVLPSCRQITYTGFILHDIIHNLHFSPTSTLIVWLLALVSKEFRQLMSNPKQHATLVWTVYWPRPQVEFRFNSTSDSVIHLAAIWIETIHLFWSLCIISFDLHVLLAC